MLRVYCAGKVDPHSLFTDGDWREQWCRRISSYCGVEVFNLDPSDSLSDFRLDEGNSFLIFGRDCFMISQADIVLVNLSDDISVGGSQEMLIAKYFGKPVFGLVRVGGKFHRDAMIGGREYKGWMHPFVFAGCDRIAKTFDELLGFVKQLLEMKMGCKDITIIDDAIHYYQKHFYEQDVYLHKWV